MRVHNKRILIPCCSAVRRLPVAFAREINLTCRLHRRENLGKFASICGRLIFSPSGKSKAFKIQFCEHVPTRVCITNSGRTRIASTLIDLIDGSTRRSKTENQPQGWEIENQHFPSQVVYITAMVSHITVNCQVEFKSYHVQ